MDKMQQDVHEWVKYCFFDTGPAAVFNVVREMVDKAKGDGLEPERVLMRYIFEDDNYEEGSLEDKVAASLYAIAGICGSTQREQVQRLEYLVALYLQGFDRAQCIDNWTNIQWMEEAVQPCDLIF